MQLLYQQSEQMTMQQGFKSIRWSDSAIVYYYTECGNTRAETSCVRETEELAHSKHTERHTFRCEADAIVSQLRKKRDQHTSQFKKILPELAKLQWAHLSLIELEEVESEILEELDSLRQIDTTTGLLQYSSEYDLVEKQFNLLLDTYECLFQLGYDDSQQLLSINEHDKKIEEAPCIEKKNRRFRWPFSIPFKTCASIDVDASESC